MACVNCNEDFMDRDTSHRCKADSTSCKDGEKCPDFIGEGNCDCKECK